MCSKISLFNRHFLGTKKAPLSEALAFHMSLLTEKKSWVQIFTYVQIYEGTETMRSENQKQKHKQNFSLVYL